MNTKKDYIRAASIVKPLRDSSKQPVAAAFVAFFRGDNPQFDSAQFRAACGLKED
jgi:hypothetical protein